MAKVVKKMTSDFNQANSLELLHEVLLTNPNAATPVWANLQQLKSILGGGSSSGRSIISATPPENPSNGDHWTSTITYIDYTYVGAWIEL